MTADVLKGFSSFLADREVEDIGNPAEKVT